MGVEQSLILRLDAAGHPTGWLTAEDAAVLYCRDQILWEIGDEHFVLRGGDNRITGTRSVCKVNSIVAARGVNRNSFAWRAPALSNPALFRRDGHLCMYCGNGYSSAQLTRDHVIPLSKGGRDVWDNVVTACARCNHRKGSLLPEAAAARGISLIAVPYVPSPAQGLILANRRILADQMAFLKSR